MPETVPWPGRPQRQVVACGRSGHLCGLGPRRISCDCYPSAACSACGCCGPACSTSGSSRGSYSSTASCFWFASAAIKCVVLRGACFRPSEPGGGGRASCISCLRLGNRGAWQPVCRRGIQPCPRRAFARDFVERVIRQRPSRIKREGIGSNSEGSSARPGRPDPAGIQLLTSLVCSKAPGCCFQIRIYGPFQKVL